MDGGLQWKIVVWFSDIRLLFFRLEGLICLGKGHPFSHSAHVLQVELSGYVIQA